MRITQRHLENKLHRLNLMAGFDNPEYSTIGAYCLDYAYGGVSLHRYVNNSGGIHDVFRCGHVPKKELYNLMSAYETGFEDCTTSPTPNGRFYHIQKDR